MSKKKRGISVDAHLCKCLGMLAGIGDGSDALWLDGYVKKLIRERNQARVDLARVMRTKK